MATVLVVEHQHPTLVRCCQILRDAGLELLTASAADPVADLCSRQRVDVAIVYGEPAKTGEMLVAEIKKLRVPPRVLLLSDAPPPKSCGADAHLYTPTQPERIFGRVVELLSGRRDAARR